MYGCERACRLATPLEADWAAAREPLLAQPRARSFAGHTRPPSPPTVWRADPTASPRPVLSSSTHLVDGEEEPMQPPAGPGLQAGASSLSRTRSAGAGGGMGRRRSEPTPGAPAGLYRPLSRVQDAPPSQIPRPPRAAGKPPAALGAAGAGVGGGGRGGGAGQGAATGRAGVLELSPPSGAEALRRARERRRASSGASSSGA